jgi:hypothetical protein
MSFAVSSVILSGAEALEHHATNFALLAANGSLTPVLIVWYKYGQLSDHELKVRRPDWCDEWGPKSPLAGVALHEATLSKRRVVEISRITRIMY